VCPAYYLGVWFNPVGDDVRGLILKS
jgi:hypothetical protein